MCKQHTVSHGMHNAFASGSVHAEFGSHWRAQSVPNSQLLNVASGPPSSQYESEANFGAFGQVLLQRLMDAGGGGGDGGGGGGGAGGGGSGASL